MSYELGITSEEIGAAHRKWTERALQRDHLRMGKVPRKQLEEEHLGLCAEVLRLREVIKETPGISLTAERALEAVRSKLREQLRK